MVDYANLKSSQQGIEMAAIDNGKIEAMVTQMRNAVSNVQAPKTPAIDNVEPSQGAVNFGQVFKAQLDQVNGLQKNAQQLGERFSMGDDSINLSDVMIASQKSGIALQTTIQVRNKLVSAYHDIMNMQV